MVDSVFECVLEVRCVSCLLPACGVDCVVQVVFSVFLGVLFGVVLSVFFGVFLSLFLGVFLGLFLSVFLNGVFLCVLFVISDSG